MTAFSIVLGHSIENDDFCHSISIENIVQDDFVLVDDAGFHIDQHPDFSDSGSDLELGFVRFNGTSGGSYSRDTGLDNWSLELNIGDIPVELIEFTITEQ